MRFRIDLKIFLFLLLFYFTRQIEIYVIMIFFAVVHELGHLLMGLMLKMKPERIELMPFGLSISFKVNVQDINKKRGNGNQQVFKEILVASAGPLTNLIILIFTYVFFGNSNFSSLVIYANLLILIFNSSNCFLSTTLGAPVIKQDAEAVFGNAITSLIFSVSVSNIVNLSSPRAKPP